MISSVSNNGALSMDYITNIGLNAVDSYETQQLEIGV